MSSSDNRIIKDAKMSTCPVVIAMHEFPQLEESTPGPEEDLAALNSLESVPQLDEKPIEPPKRMDEELLREAKKQSDELLQNTHFEIAEMKNKASRDANEEATRLKEQATAEGKQQGLDTAGQQMAEQLQQTSERCNSMIAAAEKESRQILLQAEPKIIELVLAISRKIINDEVNERPAVVLGLVRSALERVRDQHEIIIHVSPDDYDFIISSRRELQSIVGAEQSLTVTADAVLGKGGCLIETSFGTVEAGVDTQMESIRRVLQGMLP